MGWDVAKHKNQPAPFAAKAKSSILNLKDEVIDQRPFPGDRISKNVTKVEP